MIRRLSASFFLLGMAVLVLFQQPGFAYCAHTDQFFMSDCGCEELTEIACPHCQKDLPVEPCDDCSEKIQLDTDDLVWYDLTLNSPTEFSSPITDGESNSAILFSPATELSVAPTRPPPPPSGVPVFLINSVFRL